jgi:hypothetical protein
MAVSALPQAPYRQDRKIFPTPLSTDVLFSEVRDCNRSDFPEYGTPHPNVTKWPHHKLIFIKPVDIERNEIFEFFYAADRENQDEYNFASGFRSVAGARDFRVVLREYVTLRSEFDPLLPAFKDPMPDVPVGVFGDIEYVFFDKQQKKIDQTELDSLYIAEVRTYIEIAFLNEKLSFSVEKPLVTPERFRATLPTVVTEEIVEGTAELPTLTAGQISISENQINPDVKSVRTISRSSPDGNVTLNGTRTYVEQTLANTEETYSESLLEAEEGLLIVQSQVTNLGDGNYTRETVRVNQWPELIGSEWDDNIKGQVKKKQQFVAPPSGPDFFLQDTSFLPVSKDRYLRVTEEAPHEVLDGYFTSYSSTVDLNLPNVLRSIEVIWDRDTADGGYISNWTGESDSENVSFSGAERGEATGTASASPELVINIEQPWGSDCPINIHTFFIKPQINTFIDGQYTSGSFVTSDMVVKKLMTNKPYLGSVTSMRKWPTFKPLAHRIITTGKRAAVSAQCNGSFSYAKSEDSFHSDATTGSGFGISIDTTIGVNNIPPTLHGTITLSDGSDESVVARSSCAVSLPYGGSSSSSASSPEGFATIRPRTLDATYPPDIPRSGYYLLKYQSEPYKWGWHRVIASVIDTQQFAYGGEDPPIS